MSTHIVINISFLRIYEKILRLSEKTIRFNHILVEISFRWKKKNCFNHGLVKI